MIVFSKQRSLEADVDRFPANVSDPVTHCDYIGARFSLCSLTGSGYISSPSTVLSP